MSKRLLGVIHQLLSRFILVIWSIRWCVQIVSFYVLTTIFVSFKCILINRCRCSKNSKCSSIFSRRIFAGEVDINDGKGLKKCQLLSDFFRIPVRQATSQTGNLVLGFRSIKRLNSLLSRKLWLTQYTGQKLANE